MTFARASRLLLSFTALVIVIGASCLASYLVDLRWSVDQLLFRSRLGDNVMAKNTAIAFLVVGIAIVLLDVRMRRIEFHAGPCLVDRLDGGVSGDVAMTNLGRDA